MPVRESGERWQVVSGIVEHDRNLGVGVAPHRNDFGELLADLVRVGSSKDRADYRGDHVLAALGGHCENVAHEVHSAALPTRALKDGVDGFLQPRGAHQT